MAELVKGEEPKIIGLYGLPGSGKSTIMRQLKEDPTYRDFLFFEGSQVIDALVECGLDHFKRLNDQEKRKIRRQAIECIRDDCVKEKKGAIVAGHFSFCGQGEAEAAEAWTQSDAKIFTHIIYLNVDPGLLESRIKEDDSRPDRVQWTSNVLWEWQDQEMERIGWHCKANAKEVSFECLKGGVESTLEEVKNFLEKTNGHDEKHNRDLVRESLKTALTPLPTGVDAVLVVDGDKTLSSEDTGQLFWSTRPGPRKDPLPGIFDELGYSFAAFRAVAQTGLITIHPEFVALLERVRLFPSVKAIVVTCGLRVVWEIVLKEAGLSESVKVIGGGREKDYVVTPKLKAEIVRILQKNDLYVVAFGDSPLDLPMLRQADQAVVVVGDKHSRSKSMENELEEAIDKGFLNARQILLPPDVPIRLDYEKLPITCIDDLGVFRALFGQFEHIEATSKAAAKLLMTPTRDADFYGPCLREAHRNIGRYLATEYLSEHLGLQQWQMRHVQPGKFADGYLCFHEEKTLIVPLMRGGEPLAFGVSDVLPLAVFLHAKEPEDVQKKHLKGMTNVVLMDAVINTGASLVQFVKHIRKLRPTVGIVALSGVTQRDAVKGMADELTGFGGVTLISLRTSANKYTGKGGTDMVRGCSIPLGWSDAECCKEGKWHSEGEVRTVFRKLEEEIDGCNSSS